VIGIWKLTIIFGDIDLCIVVTVARADQPKSWPDPGSCRHFHARFKVSPRLRKSTALSIKCREQSCLPFPVRSFSRGNLQPPGACSEREIVTRIGKSGIAEIAVPGRVRNPFRRSPRGYVEWLAKCVRKSLFVL